MSKSQLDIFGRASGAVKGSNYKPWWLTNQGSTFSSLYNRVNFTYGVIKKSLKLFKHRKNVMNRAQIVDPTMNADSTFANSSTNYSSKQHWAAGYSHIKKALAYLVADEFHIYLNDIWANLKRKQSVDIGSAIHQKLHQIYSNRVIKVPDQYEDVIGYLVHSYNKLTTWRMANNRNMRRIPWVLLGMDPYRYGGQVESLHKVSEESDGSSTNFSVYVAMRQFLLNNEINGLHLTDPEELLAIRDLLEQSESDISEDDHKMSSMKAYIYEKIVHMLEDVYIDDRLSEKAPGYVKYLTKFKENKVKDKSWLKAEVEEFKGSIKAFINQYLQRVVINDDDEIDSASVLRNHLIPMREYVTLHVATMIMKYIITLPELVEDAVEKHLDSIIHTSKVFISGVCSNYSVDEKLFLGFDVINLKTFEKHLKEYSSKITSDILDDPNAGIVTAETMFSYYEDALKDIYDSCSDEDKKSLQRSEEYQVGQLSYNRETDSIQGKGLSRRMNKEIGDHVKHNTDYYNTKDPGILEIIDGDDSGRKHKVIVDRYESGDQEEYNKLVRDLKPQINALRRKIDLYGLDRHVEVRNLNKGQLDRKALYKIPTRHVNLFRKEFIDHEPDMNIGILMDQSGSMYGSIDLVRDTAIMLYESMKDNKLVQLFLYGHNADNHREGTSTHVYEYNNGNSLTKVEANACNRDGVAIYESAKMMLEQIHAKAHTKNVLFVLCDGQPSATGYYQGVRKTARSVRAVENLGISVASIGMGGHCSEDKLKEMYRYHFSIENVAAVQTHLPKMIRHMLKI